jgi:8-oxo-dGTP pyrophosphatase MutT (NUDIX family)
MSMTINDARRHLRIDGTQDDMEILQRLVMAQFMVLAYISTPPADDPEAIQRRYYEEAAIDAAVLLIVGELWMNRESSTAVPLSDSVKALLQMFREPTYA